MKTKKERARTISPRITDSAREELAKAYGNANAGAQRAIRSWIPLRHKIRTEIKEFFTTEELDVITSAYEDMTTFYPENAMSEDALSIRVEVELRNGRLSPPASEQLTEKIEQLTAAERFFLVELVMVRRQS